ncbi:MAG TPA: class I SAM-dependent methyltransferase [bacterium]|nr:class I SAM-dependent methyltransferase [bacterium]
MNNEFDLFAKDYRKIHNENLKISGANSNYFTEYKILEVKRSEKGKKIESIFDFGCGDGTSLVYFRKHFPSADLCGVDVSLKSIEEANSKNIKNSNIFLINNENDLKNLIEDNKFDIIFISCVFHHIEDENILNNILKECFRILKNDGVLYIFEHNPYNPMTRRIVKDCIFDKGIRLINPKKLKKLVLNNQFKNSSVNFTLFFPRFSIFKPFFIFEKFLIKLPIGGQYYIKAKKYE